MKFYQIGFPRLNWLLGSQIQGIPLDYRLNFDPQVDDILTRARGLEAGILRSTSNALLVTLVRRGLTLTGLGSYETSFRSLIAQLINVPARPWACRLNLLHGQFRPVTCLYCSVICFWTELLGRALAPNGLHVSPPRRASRIFGVPPFCRYLSFICPSVHPSLDPLFRLASVRHVDAEEINFYLWD